MIHGDLLMSFMLNKLVETEICGFFAKTYQIYKTEIANGNINSYQNLEFDYKALNYNSLSNN